ncbi:cell division ATP-binding protein FtsE [Candidatus Woesebacteria bacterium]|nr:MAG: cell division ATP-binding protein FtsE [Candidatus Woesebacteria bacterium]
MLEIKNVTKRFGSTLALDDVSFIIEEGEFVFLTGPSGSGKTTLLRLIMRDLIPDMGEILLAKENIINIKSKNIPKLRQKMGVVFQDFKLLQERTARENVEVALAVIGLDQKEWKERVDHVLSLVGLKDRSEFFPSQLSGGELQRISLARALVVNPKIILADEPTGNLDWETAQKLMDLFENINKEGKTIVMATHHKGLIDSMKKRVIVLEKPTNKIPAKETKDKKPKNSETKKNKKNSKEKK